MLEYLHLENVGPAAELELALAPRLNLITGDNGLGKSFLLDVAWWAVTRTWAGYPVRPSLETIKGRKRATIAFRYDGAKKVRAYESTFVPAEQEWTGSSGRPANPGLVIYARVDGGFAVWDPTRNQKAREIAQSEGMPAPGLPRLYNFAPPQVWEGIKGEGSQMLCNGLIRDWVSWQLGDDWKFKALRDALGVMSEAGDALEPGPRPTRISIEDVTDYPTLRTSYGQDVAIVLASAAVRRIAALAYLLVWTWTEHEAMSAQMGIEPSRRLIFLVDEVESHLHPRWQRTVVPSLLRVVQALAPKAEAQIIVSTHSPLVLASVESVFDAKVDAWFDLDVNRAPAPAAVELRKRPFVRHGEVDNWLTSEAFDLKSPRSLEAEAAIEQALALLGDQDPAWKDVELADRKLREARLPDIDPFWVRWGKFVDDRRPGKRVRR